MSLGYAERLSFREDLGGRLGAPELFDDPSRVMAGAERLAEMVHASRRVLVFTGAGISTACGIPDFRGPNGVWTLQRAGKPPPRLQTSFVYAKPSLTHMALLALLRAGKVTYICSQNVDGLHLRSGIPRSQLAELHGDCFAERCRRCGKEYIRDFEMDTVGFKASGRTCSKPGCGRPLHDHILDWEDALPEDELEETERQADEADLSICLGTSLQIIPAANLPLRTLKTGGQLAIINLQATPKDRRANLVIHSRVDGVMALLLRRLGLPIPDYVRSDHVIVSYRTFDCRHKFDSATAGGAAAAAAAAIAAAAAEEDKEVGGDSNGSSEGSNGGGSGDGWGFEVCVSSVHGPECPIPMLKGATLSVEGGAALKAVPSGSDSGSNDGSCGGGDDGGPSGNRCEGPAPLVLRRWVAGGGQVRLEAALRLELDEAADEGRRNPQFIFVIQRGSSCSERFSFVTQRHDYGPQQQRLCAELEAAAAAAPAAAAAGGGSWPVQEHGGRGRGRGRSGGRGRSRGRAAGNTRYDEEEVEAEQPGLMEDGSREANRGSSVSAEAGVAGRVRKRAKRLNL